MNQMSFNSSLVLLKILNVFGHAPVYTPCLDGLSLDGLRMWQKLDAILQSA